MDLVGFIGQQFRFRFASKPLLVKLRVTDAGIEVLHMDGQ